MRKTIISFLITVNLVYSFTEEDFFQILKKKREFLSSGVIYMKIYELKWDKEEEYKKFSKELKNKIYLEPLDFKKWFAEKKETLPYSDQLFKWKNAIYYFFGIEKFPYKKEHYIEEIPLENFKKQIVSIKEKHKNIKIRYPIKLEYLWDGLTYKEYEIYLTEEYGGENILTIYTDEKETAKYFKLWFIDYSFSFLENLPKLNKSFKFEYKEGKIVLNDGRLIFEPKFSCGCIHVLAYNKNNVLATEIISGAYFLVNDIVHLPYFSSNAKILSNGAVEQTLYIIEKYELRPILNDEFTLKIIPPTKVIDYSFGVEPKIYYYEKKY